MKAILYITAIVLLCSCSLFRKVRKDEFHQVIEETKEKFDSSALHQKDSVSDKEQHHQEWWAKDTASRNEEVTITEKITTTTFDSFGRKQAETTTERKTEKKTTEGKKQESGGWKNDFVEHQGISTSDMNAVSNATDHATVKTDTRSEDSKSRCGFPYWWVVVLAGVGNVLWKKPRLFKFW